MDDQSYQYTCLLYTSCCDDTEKGKELCKPDPLFSHAVLDIVHGTSGDLTDVYKRQGYEQTTMRDIASAVGVVPGLCYRYFESKQVLFEQAVRQYVSDYCAPIVRALKEHSGDMSSARCV